MGDDRQPTENAQVGQPELHFSAFLFGTNNEKGTGLGLVLVNEFVALNDGSISVSSEPGKGTTFTLEFPNK